MIIYIVERPHLYILVKVNEGQYKFLSTVLKSENSCLAFGSSIEEAVENAKKKGYKIDTANSYVELYENLKTN